MDETLMRNDKPRHWRSLEERDETPEALQAARDEFKPGAMDPGNAATTDFSRRTFLGLVGATAALATTLGCDRSGKSLVVPYTRRPHEVVPGVATYYASTFSEGLRSYAVLVKTREGRPIHISGNDEHPRLKGRTAPRAVADVLSLYDPDRLRGPRHEGREASWQDAETALLQALKGLAAQGRKALLLTRASLSPTRQALLEDLKQVLPALETVVWEPAAGEGAQEGGRLCYGKPVACQPRLEGARVILSLGADFLAGDDPEAIAAFTEARRPVEPVTSMNRLWVIEGPMTLTGAKADHRFPVRVSRIAGLAFALARDLGLPMPAGARLPVLPEEAHREIPDKAWRHLVEDLRRAGGQAVVLCGEAMPAEAHVAAHLLNTMLGSRQLELRETPATARLQEMASLRERMAKGVYGAAILWGVNPAYAFPDREGWAEAFRSIPFRAWLGQIEDESMAACTWQLPEHHWLEAWGDHQDGDVLSLQQPAIGALYDTRQGEEVLLAVVRALGGPSFEHYLDYLKHRWSRDVQPTGNLVPFERFWEAALHDGVLVHGQPQPAPVFQGGAVEASARRAIAAQAASFDLFLRPGTQVWDGRYGNNGWLQELPDPVTKATWGNPLSLAVSDARELGVKEGDLVEIRVDEQSWTLPVLLQPGQAKGVVALALGYGRTIGDVAKGVGVNAYPMLDTSGSCPNLRVAVKLSKGRGRKEIPFTQNHHRMDGRDLVRTFSLKEFAKKAAEPHRDHDLATLYPDMDFPEHKWGMAIDLAACVGCGACVLACQSENNVPTVGPEQVLKGREMHWIRVDRYYEGSEDNPSVVHQPMLCQHCDHAPCENVCPVNATNHSPDGLNQMAYNRCVGTRYCANNCPYKVRRFNFLEFTAQKTEPESLVYNPEVSVRPRGVMEKCTFCVQRIQDGRMRAKGEKRPVRDGEIVPACAAACPSQAIVFGDLKDPKSLVSQLSHATRGYKVLEELGARPAITYLADLKNPAIEGELG